jgi:hypothetical protein
MDGTAIGAVVTAMSRPAWSPARISGSVEAVAGVVGETAAAAAEVAEGVEAGGTGDCDQARFAANWTDER